MSRNDSTNRIKSQERSRSSKVASSLLQYAGMVSVLLGLVFYFKPDE